MEKSMKKVMILLFCFGFISILFFGCQESNSSSGDPADPALLTEAEMGAYADEAMSEAGWDENSVTEVSNDNSGDVMDAVDALDNQVTSLPDLSLAAHQPNMSSINQAISSLITKKVMAAQGADKAQETLQFDHDCPLGGNVVGTIISTEDYNEEWPNLYYSESYRATMKFTACVIDSNTIIYGRVVKKVSESDNAQGSDFNGDYPSTVTFSGYYRDQLYAGLAATINDNIYKLIFYSDFSQGSQGVATDIVWDDGQVTAIGSITGSQSRNFSGRVNQGTCSGSETVDIEQSFSEDFNITCSGF